MSEKLHKRIFTVEGSGRFPIDMLRYDSCWPERQIDACNISVNVGVRRVLLGTYTRIKSSVPCTEARWRSFNWRVISVDELC